MNKVFIIGRLTRDPEARTTASGISVTAFSVAVNRRVNREETDFLNIVAWRSLADSCAKYLVRGQQVAVAGEIRTRTYDAKDGTKRTVTEIQAEDVEFLAKPASVPNQAPPRQDEHPKPGKNDFAAEMDGLLVDDEEQPF